MDSAGHPYIKQYMMTAGPTPLPPEVVSAMTVPLPHHREPAFVELYARVLAGLKDVFQTKNEVLVFASSGTGAMESAVANLVGPGDAAIVASCGKFGERWQELCDAYGADTLHLAFEWGERVEPADVDRALAEHEGRAKAVFTTQCETSTGVVNDIRALAEVAARHEALLCVDAISGLGVVDLPADEWGVDVVVSGSQKSLMCPPGLAFVAVSERALRAANGSAGSRYYFDWAATAKAQLKDAPDSPFTPAISLLSGLDVALSLIATETLPAVFARHANLGRATRGAVKALDLELFGPEDENANVVTVVEMPDGVDGVQVARLMRDRYGVTVAGGQGKIKGRVVRIGHCGYYGAMDTLVAIGALEQALNSAGAGIELGAGVARAQQVYAEAGAAVAPSG